MQCYDNKNAFGGFILDVGLFGFFFFKTGFARTLPFFAPFAARFAHSLPRSGSDK
jgi:hypothetical protein